MDRKQFFKTTLQACAGFCCCGSVLAQGIANLTGKTVPSQRPWIDDFEKRVIGATQSPPAEKVRKSVLWIKDLMNNMDNFLDPETNFRLMQANGRSCYINAFGVAGDEPVPPEQIEGFMKYLRDGGCEIKQESNTTTVIYSWGRNHQNPSGLIMSDGFCMCPVVEDVTEGLSPTFCLCSAGYVKEIFERQLGKPATVTVLESLKMGGKDCRFKVVF